MVDIEDAPQLVIDIIENDYNLASVNNTVAPIFIAVRNAAGVKRLNAGAKSGIIKTYEIDYQTDYQYAARKRNDEIALVSVDMRFRDGNYLQSNRKHIRNILEANQKVDNYAGNMTAGTTNPFKLMYIQRERDFTNTDKGFFRCVIDVELTILGKVRAT